MPMTATTTAAVPQLVLRSLDATWDYARWERLPYDGNRYEVLDGVLYMTTSPSTFHQWIDMQLLRVVGLPAHERGLAYPFIAPTGLLMPGAQPAQPDFLLVRHERADIIHDGRIRGVPDLIAEILSPSNPETDTDIKLGIYARTGVPEYWIVRPATRDILVHWQPDRARGTYSQVNLSAADTRLVSPTLPIEFAVADLFAGAPDTSL
jgi:Uma2 family endonuclease